jgi:fibronectin type 3 domain-containing protein
LTRSYYADGTARAGTAYYYCVAAVDTAGNVSPLSAQAWATIPGSNLAPAVPGGLVATAATSSISLNWNDNSESDLAGYLVYRSTTSGTGFTPLAENLTQSSYADTSIQAGTTYYYIVFAFDTSGNTSAASAQVSATVPAAAAGFFETIAWSAPTANTDGSTLKDLAGYKVYVGTSSRKYSSVHSAGNVTQYTVGPLAAGTYYFCVTSCDSSGNESPYSTEVTYKVQ